MDKERLIRLVAKRNKENGNDDLWGGSKTCIHVIKGKPRGGVECTKCGAWFCY